MMKVMVNLSGIECLFSMRRYVARFCIRETWPKAAK